MAKILVVDDDLYIRELYEEILERAGFEVVTAVDGEDGLAKTRQGGFNLILLDIKMPKLDGLGVLNNLAQTPPKVKNGPIVLLTNMAYDPIIQEALAKGASGYLVKVDLNPKSLVTKVAQLIKKSQRTQ